MTVPQQDRQGMLPMEAHPDDSPFVLRELEVFNWGPFSGMHHVEVDPRGTAIIGPTGSGKTTLIDALMTLLVPNPRYNLASTGGHESDRTLLSYVRGHLGADGSVSGGDEVARPGKVHCGICGTYARGDETLKLGTVLWVDGVGNSAQDLKRRWIFSQAEGETLEGWLRLVHGESVRHLMRRGRETAQLRIFEHKKSYLAHVRKFFGVGENAFTLLNRAAGLKQLNSIDEIFRELVLDDHSAFDRAIEVAGEFDNLAEIHAELETAQRQHQSLLPIRRESEKLSKAHGRRDALELLRRIAPIWFAMAGERLWASREHALSAERESLAGRLELANRERGRQKSRVETLFRVYLQLGGESIRELERAIEEIRIQVGENREHAEQYQGVMAKYELDPRLDKPTLLANQALLEQERASLAKRFEAKETEELDARSKLRDAEKRVNELDQEIRRVEERPGSNVPPPYQDFRSLLAGRLGVDEEALCFAAELVEVRAEEHQWRGAIERAIGGERLRLLVPQRHMNEALRWVNDRDNRLYVRLLDVKEGVGAAQFFPDGFTRKLAYKNHPQREAVKGLLARIDRHCVDSPEALRSVDHGMTIEGLMSGREGKFEKQDQRPLSAGWMTGFDNRDQLRELTEEREALAGRKARLQETVNALQHERRQVNVEIKMVEAVCGLAFETIDVPGAERELEDSVRRLEALAAEGSATSRAKEEYELAAGSLEQIEAQLRELEKAIAVLEDNRNSAAKSRAKYASRAGEGLSPDHQALAAREIALSADVDVEQIDDCERVQQGKLETKLEDASKRVGRSEQELVRIMGAAKRADTGALVETGTELADIPDYLEQLKVLETEALPEKQERFLTYLNQSSDQGVTQLLAGISEEVDEISMRIDELNRTLEKVDFQQGRHLRLRPKRIRHERLRSLEEAQRRLRSAAFQEDSGASHFKALRAVVDILREAGENRRQLGSRALLDPRHRLEFAVVIVDGDTGETSAPRTGSQSGSGGEKELMASHILTAALSYALCPSEGTRPLYGTIVLDEAFSKSSPSAAGRIIEALRVFGLHPIFVTPNKEIGLLRRHTRKAVCVQRSGNRASLATISWEELDDIASRSVPGPRVS